MSFVSIRSYKRSRTLETATNSIQSGHAYLKIGGKISPLQDVKDLYHYTWGKIAWKAFETTRVPELV